VDAIISIGGDGTLLETITYVGDLEKPILGINIGRLGFLATISKKILLKLLNHLVNGFYSIDERHLVSVESETKIFEEANFGLNEFAILKEILLQ
jgi:NAD+ kinase